MEQKLTEGKFWDLTTIIHTDFYLVFRTVTNAGIINHFYDKNSDEEECKKEYLINEYNSYLRNCEIK